MSRLLPKLIILLALPLLYSAALENVCCTALQVQPHTVAEASTPIHSTGFDYSHIRFIPATEMNSPYLQMRYKPQSYGLQIDKTVKTSSQTYSLPNVSMAQLYQELAFYCGSSRSGKSLTIGLGQNNGINFLYKAGHCQGTSLYERVRNGLQNR